MNRPSEPMPSLYSCVRTVYSTYRTEAMNKKYYGCRLSQIKRWNVTLEIVIAVGASSAIGAWALWRNPTGQCVWAMLTGLAAILAVAKPILRYSDRIERYTRLFAGHAVALHDLAQLTGEIEGLRDYPRALHKTYVAILARIRELTPEDDPNPDSSLLRHCFEEVKVQIPVDHLWWPTEGEENHG